MKIYEVHGTTGTTAFHIKTRAMVEEKAIVSIIEKIIGEYGQRIVNGPDYLREYAHCHNRIRFRRQRNFSYKDDHIPGLQV